MKVDFLISACDELEDLKGLIYYLKYFCNIDDNIIIILDGNNTNQNMINMIKKSNVVLHILNWTSYKQMSEMAMSKASGDICFHLCPDEIPTIPVLQSFRDIFRDSKIDAVAIPRINIFSNLNNKNNEEMYVGNRGKGYLLKEPINEYEWHHWPDYQVRITRNIPQIKWGNSTHSGIIGYNNLVLFPQDPMYSLLHVKSVERQERILKLYDKINLG